MRPTLVLLFVFLFSGATLSALDYGASRADVLKELGKPENTLQRGNHEVITFRGNVRIELDDGKVVLIRGLALADGAGGFATNAGAAAAPAAKAAVPKPDPEEEARARAEAEMERRAAAEDAKARAKMEKAIEEMEKDHEKPPAVLPSRSFSPVRFLLELGVKWLLLVAALKLTFKYWGADIEWLGLAVASGADTTVRGIVSAVGHAMGAFSLFYADEALAAVVLVLVLRKVSTNKSLQQAVTITMTCKTFSVVVGAVLVTFALNALA